MSNLIVAWQMSPELKRDRPIFKCFMCEKRLFKERVLARRIRVVNNRLEEYGPFVLSGEAAFHLDDTHGLPPDIFEIFLEQTQLILKPL